MLTYKILLHIYIIYYILNHMNYSDLIFINITEGLIELISEFKGLQVLIYYPIRQCVLVFFFFSFLTCISLEVDVYFSA